MDSAKRAILKAIEMRYSTREAPDAGKKPAAVEVVAETVVVEPELSNHMLDMSAQAAYALFKAGRVADCVELVGSVWPFINELDDDVESRNRSLLHHAAHKEPNSDKY